MAHFVRTQSDATWISGYTPPGSDFQSLDQKTFKAVNGDEGGTWAPSSPIIIGGQGQQLAGHNHLVLAGGRLSVQSGGGIDMGGGRMALKTITNTWTGNSTWTGTTFTGGALQLIADLDFTTYGIQVGDEVHFSIDYTALLHPSTQAWLRLSAGESTSYFTGGTDTGGATGLSVAGNVPGETIIGPYYYTLSDLTLPTYHPLAMRAKYVVVGGGDNHVYLAVSAKVLAYDGSASPEVTVDQSLGNLPDANFSYSAQIWRPVP